MKVSYIIVTIVIAAFCLLLWTKYFNTDRFIAEKLPQRLEAYPLLDSLAVISSENLDMELLLESTTNLQYFVTPDTHIVAYGVHGDTANVFFKLSPKGGIVDTLSINSRPSDIAFINGFIINAQDHQYHKWSYDGKKNPTDIVEENKSFDWSDQKQQEHLYALQKKAGVVPSFHTFETPEPQKASDDRVPTVPSVGTFTILTYFVGDVCYQFYTKKDVHEQFPYAYTRKLLVNNIFKRFNSKVSGDKELIKTPNIRYQYFQKTDLEKVEQPVGGGVGGAYTEMLYHGYLFTDIHFRNGTIRIKEFMYLEHKGNLSDVEIEGKNIGSLFKNKRGPDRGIKAYMFYTEPAIDYALFSNSDKKLYIIKAKKEL